MIVELGRRMTCAGETRRRTSSRTEAMESYSEFEPWTSTIVILYGSETQNSTDLTWDCCCSKKKKVKTKWQDYWKMVFRFWRSFCICWKRCGSCSDVVMVLKQFNPRKYKMMARIVPASGYSDMKIVNRYSLDYSHIMFESKDSYNLHSKSGFSKKMVRWESTFFF